MKKCNLLNEIIIVDRPALMQAINSAKTFGITHEGRVLHAPFESREIYIYQGMTTPPAPGIGLAPQKQRSLSELLGVSYQVVEDGDRVLIKTGSAWQEIIKLNLAHCDYDDSTGDGIDKFTDNELEEIGWQATEFDVMYRDIVDVIEAKCEGTLLCVESEGENYQFSGLGYINDMACARQVAFEYCQALVKKALETDEHFAPDNLTDDEEEAAKFFKAL
ncbi:MAG: hypothetical protein U9Q62_05675 [Campylobacterota bacterium]|nr:hypothetical protein [Campylobacterota bacterium]